MFLCYSAYLAVKAVCFVVSGRSIIGRVSEAHVGRRSSDCDYAFSVNGIEYSGRAESCRREAGEEISVRYLAGFPQVNQHGPIWGLFHLIILVLGLVGTGVGGFILWKRPVYADD